MLSWANVKHYDFFLKNLILKHWLSLRDPRRPDIWHFPAVLPLWCMQMKVEQKKHSKQKWLILLWFIIFSYWFYCGLLFSCTYFWYCISLNVSAPVVFKCAAWIICGSFYYLIWLYTADQPQQKAGLTAWKGSNNSFKSETSLINVHAQIWFSG